jgi:hypothetical protein
LFSLLISAYDYLLYTLRSAFPEQLSCDRIAFPVTQKPSQAYIMLETVIKVLYYRGTTQIDESSTFRCTNIHSSLVTGSVPVGAYCTDK